MKINYFYIMLFSFLITIAYSRSMEFTSCKTYTNVEKNLEAAEEWGLKALEVEPDNSYIPFFIGQFIYRKQKRRLEAGKMFLDALNKSDTRLESPFRIGKDTWINTVHQAITREAYNWFNYGVEASEKGQYDDAVEHFMIASKLDSGLTGSCYNAIATIYYSNKKDLNKALEFIDIALNETKDEKIILELKINKATYLRKNNKLDEAAEILSNIPNDELNKSAKYELFLLHMDSNDCPSAITLGKALFIDMEIDPKVSMGALSELAFNIGVCFNQEADRMYNQLIDYLGAEIHSNDLTTIELERCEETKESYSSAKEYFRTSLNYDETSSETTKAYKKEMRANIRKVDEQIIPTLESLLK